MLYAKSLRAIGQSLQSPGFVAFIIEKDGKDYVIRSDSLSDISALIAKKDTSEKIWDGSHLGKNTKVIRRDRALEYTPSYISWLDAQGRKKRRKRFSTQARGTMNLSQLLRSLGRHLERLEPHAFRIAWSADGICIDYELTDGQHVTETLSNEKLRELSLRMSFRRSSKLSL